MKFPDNIYYGYALSAFQSAFFWYAPWLLFLYQYISISQAVILSAVGLLITIVAEVPTGAFSDLFGKKLSLQIAFLLVAIGEFATAFSTDFSHFLITWSVMSLGYCFSSGTLEAFMYDSLAEKNMDSRYPSVVSKLMVITNASTAFASVLGGYIYSFWPAGIFILTGAMKVLGFAVCFFISEPQVDTQEYSLSAFVKQTRTGFKQLVRPHLIKISSLLLIYGSFMIVSYEILDDVAVVDWGYNEIQIGYLYAGLLFLSLPGGLIYTRVRKLMSPLKIVFGAALILMLNYLFSPLITVSVWTTIFAFRVLYSPLKESAISELLNTHTPSPIRATTLSTYQLLRRLPFVLLFFPLSFLIELDVKLFSSLFGASLLACLVVFVIWFWIGEKKDVGKEKLIFSDKQRASNNY